MILSKSPKFVEKLLQSLSLSLSLSLGHSRSREVWSSKKKLTTKRRWSIQAALLLSLNNWWIPNPQKNKTETKTKTLPIFPVLSPCSSLIAKLPNSALRCDAAPSRTGQEFSRFPLSAFFPSLPLFSRRNGNTYLPPNLPTYLPYLHTYLLTMRIVLFFDDFYSFGWKNGPYKDENRLFTYLFSYQQLLMFSTNY